MQMDASDPVVAEPEEDQMYIEMQTIASYPAIAEPKEDKMYIHLITCIFIVQSSNP